MKNKIVKTLGLASVLGASTAMGATTVGLATQPLLTIGTQSLKSSAVTAGTGANLGKTWYNIVDNTDASINANIVAVGALDMVVTPGFTKAVAGTYYLRLDYTNAIIKTPIVAGTWGINNTNRKATAVLQSGGAAGASSAIYLMTQTTAAGTTTDTLTIPFVDLAVLGTATATAKISFYTTLAQATNAVANTSIAEKSQNMVAFADIVSPTATATAVEADVASNFKNFTIKNATNNASKTDASLGSITHPLNAVSTIDADGSIAVAGDAYAAASSTMTLTGDLSAGTWFMDTTSLCPLAGATGTTAIAATQKLTLNAAKTSGTITGTIFNASPFICNVVDTTSSIPAGAYSIGVTYASATAGDLVLTWAGGAIGAVSRNGTTNQINYLTTFTGYNQKVIITNRATIAGTYAFTFQTESDTTAVAGTAATGTLPASSVTVIKATDLVTLTGKSRASATFTAVLPPTSIGVATTQVNLSDGATDTVTYRN
jgi:hypothetical protein